MKEIKFSKKIYQYILIGLSSLFLVLLLIWLGFSFFSMKSDKPYVGMLINFEDNTLAGKVKRDFPTWEGNIIMYSFPIILEQYSDTGDTYVISGIPFNYEYYYDSRDDARFEYTLDKDLGVFDFTQVEWNDPLVVTLGYRVDQDIKFFADYTVCTLRKFISNLFDTDSPCGRGNCVIERELVKWSIEEQDKDILTKQAYFETYDFDTLVRGLFNFYITTDVGIFDGVTLKLSSIQTANPDGTYKFNSNYVFSDKLSSSYSSTLPWVLATASYVNSNGYEEYASVDLQGYMQKILEYTPETFTQSFLDCQLSFEVVNNLKDCDTSECEEISRSAFTMCKKAIESEISSYSSASSSYMGYEYIGSGNGYLFSLPSELIYYNRIVDLLGSSDTKYDNDTIHSYYANAEGFVNDYPSIIGQCHLLKASGVIFDTYGEVAYSTKGNTIYAQLPDFDTVCDGNIKDQYCSLSIAKKLVCADALVGRDTEMAKNILMDIFYRHYFESPASAKMYSYENLRDTGVNIDLSKTDLTSLDEYGYFVTRRESLVGDQTQIGSTADLIDSYYFIYLMNKLYEEE